MLFPWSKNGQNDEGNLVTACHKCNNARGNRSVTEFCKSVAGYLSDSPDAIERYIMRQIRKRIDMSQATALLKNRRISDVFHDACESECCDSSHVRRHRA